LLPEPLRVPDHGFVEDEGIGLHWIRHVKPGAPRDSKRAEDLLFSPRTLGHGSFSGCVFVVDPEQQLVVTQVRKQSGPRSAEWSARFFQTIAAAVSGDLPETRPLSSPGASGTPAVSAEDPID